MIDPEAWACVGWWQDYKSLGALPGDGSSLMDAPAYVYEGIKKCEETTLELKSEHEEKQRQEFEEAKRKAEQGRR